MFWELLGLGMDLTCGGLKSFMYIHNMVLIIVIKRECVYHTPETKKWFVKSSSQKWIFPFVRLWMTFSIFYILRISRCDIFVGIFPSFTPNNLKFWTEWKRKPTWITFFPAFFGGANHFTWNHNESLQGNVLFWLLLCLLFLFAAF